MLPILEYIRVNLAHFEAENLQNVQKNAFLAESSRSQWVKCDLINLKKVVFIGFNVGMGGQSCLYFDCKKMLRIQFSLYNLEKNISSLFIWDYALNFNQSLVLCLLWQINPVGTHFPGSYLSWKKANLLSVFNHQITVSFCKIFWRWSNS